MSYAILVILILVLAYTYLGYPWLLQRQSKGRKLDYAAYSKDEDLPVVYVLIPACNEEKVIAEKLQSVLRSDYPQNKLNIVVGLDACTDRTAAVIREAISSPKVRCIEFTTRQGKPALINQLVMEQLPDDPAAILLLTDANVFFESDTVYQLVRYFKDPRIGLVDANICPRLVTNMGEQAYWNYETQVKLNESLVYGKIPGPSGGCYALRRSLYTPVPANFRVDDFFIGFSVVLKDYHTILNPEARAGEDAVTAWKQEFRRKVRIASGNFQNLWHFKLQAWKPWTSTGFIFLSHKILRWKTPFFLAMVYYILLLEWTLFILIVTLFLPLIELLFVTFGFEFKPLRRFSYFIIMNIAVFVGFIEFCKGIQSNVWQPTTR